MLYILLLFGILLFGLVLLASGVVLLLKINNKFPGIFVTAFGLVVTLSTVAVFLFSVITTSIQG